jgi:hypothetical protein
VPVTDRTSAHEMTTVAHSPLRTWFSAAEACVVRRQLKVFAIVAVPIWMLIWFRCVTSLTRKSSRIALPVRSGSADARRRMFATAPVPVVVTCADCVPRTNVDVSFMFDAPTPDPDADQPCPVWNCCDHEAARYAGRFTDGVTRGSAASWVST